MRKTIFLVTMLLLVSTAFAIGWQYNSSEKKVSYNLKKGWNLINAGFEGSPQNCEGTAVQFSDSALAVYVWISPLGKYAGGVLKNGSVVNAPDYPQSLDTMKDYALPAVWVYLKNDCRVTSNSITSNQLLTGEGVPTKIARGWNFVAVLPYMVGTDIKDLFYGCSITKANMWDAETQNWQQSSSTQAAQSMSGAIKDSDVGSAMVVYAANECELGEGPALTPPPLPD